MARGILFLTLVGAAFAATKTGLPFIHDDYPRDLKWGGI
jgi:hypothetical protein